MEKIILVIFLSTPLITFASTDFENYMQFEFGEKIGFIIPILLLCWLGYKGYKKLKSSVKNDIDVEGKDKTKSRKTNIKVAVIAVILIVLGWITHDLFRAHQLKQKNCTQVINYDGEYYFDGYVSRYNVDDEHVFKTRTEALDYCVEFYDDIFVQGISAGITSARADGIPDDIILERVYEVNPNIQDTIDKALEFGANPTQILEEIIKNN